MIVIPLALGWLALQLFSSPASRLVAMIPASMWTTARKAQQQQMVQKIETAFVGAGLPLTAAAAAVVNAWAESKLNPEAVGDSGHSIGLFQLSDWGAGHDMTVAERKIADVNIKTILVREVLVNAGKRFRQRAAEGADPRELAAIFSADIERPKDREGQQQARAALAIKLFPGMIGQA